MSNELSVSCKIEGYKSKAKKVQRIFEKEREIHFVSVRNMVKWLIDDKLKAEAEKDEN